MAARTTERDATRRGGRRAAMWTGVAGWLVGLGSGLWSFRVAAGRSRSGPVARNGKEETGDPAGRAQGDKEGFKRGGRAGEGGKSCDGYGSG
jgi:hypothetical protein